MAFFSEWKPKEKRVVEAIHEGRIIKVYEEDAIREGLFILRKLEDKPSAQERPKEEERKLLFDDFRKPLKWSAHQVISELKDNFHWDVVQKRKLKGMTRKQAAQAMGMSEFDLKSIENGILPSNDFVMINKIEQFFRISLRKAGDFNQSPRELVEKKEEKDMNEGVEFLDLDK